MDPSAGEEPMPADEPVRIVARLSRVWEHLVALLLLRARQARGDAGTAARNFAMGVVFGLAAVVLFLLALPLLVTTVILALATILPPWLAVLIVLGVLLLAVAALLIMARARLRRPRFGLLDDLRADWQAIRRRVGGEQ